MADPTKDFEGLLRFFESRGAKVVVVGAHAVAYHAKPRYTKDLDILLEASVDNARRGRSGTDGRNGNMDRHEFLPLDGTS